MRAVVPPAGTREAIPAAPAVILEREAIRLSGKWSSRPVLGRPEENLGSIKTGKAYKLPDGTIFIAASDQSYNKYYPPHLPTESGYEWLGVKLSGTVISSDKITDGKLTVTVNYGDILENPDGSLSIWKNSASNTWGVPISDGNWIKLVLA